MDSKRLNQVLQGDAEWASQIFERDDLQLCRL